MKIADMSITDEELKKELAELLALVNALFAVLVILGIVADPTTEGLHDSQRALSYERPFSDAKNAD